MKRDIFNYLNEKVGELELPDGTSDAIWEQKLAVFRIPPPTVIFPDVTPRQMRQALVLSGISIEQIEIALSSLPEPTKSLAMIEWEYSLAFQRNRPLVRQVGLLLGWTDQQLDELWRFASSL